MLHLRRSIVGLLGVFALLAVLVPASAVAQGPGTSVRLQVLRAATAPVGGAVTKQELPGCFNPSEPFAGASQGGCLGVFEYQEGGK